MSELTGGNTGFCVIEDQSSYLNLSTISLNTDTQYTYYLHQDLHIPWKIDNTFLRNITWSKQNDIPDLLLQPAGKTLKVSIIIGTKKMKCDGKVYFGRLYCLSDKDFWQVTQSRKEFFIGDPNFTGIYPKNGISLSLQSRPENIQLKQWIRGRCLSRSANIFDYIPQDVVNYILDFLYSYWLVPNFVHVSDDLFA